MSDERTNYKSEFGTIRLFGKKIVEEEPKREEEEAEFILTRRSQRKLYRWKRQYHGWINKHDR